MEQSKEQDPLEPIRSAPEAVRRIIDGVLKLEKERLYQKSPHINDDIIRLIKEHVK